MSDAQLFALLEERGYKRWEIGRMDRGYCGRIIAYPRDEKHRLLDEKNPNTREGEYWIKMREKLRKEGWPDWRIYQYFNEGMEQQRQQQIQEAQENQGWQGLTGNDDFIPVQSPNEQANN